ncbi:MAG: class D sortase [Clostridia bacterium]|nr:class D sortase [Clostridia bacterium]
MDSRFGKKLLILLAVSVVFALLGYLLLFACGSSLLSPVVSAWKLFRSSSATETDVSDGNEESMDFWEREMSRIQEQSSVDESSKDPDVISLIESDESSVSGDTISSALINFPYYGDKFAEISVDGTSIQGASLYFGDGKAQLKKGVGMYAGSSYPGMGSTCLISGHNNRDFHALKDAEVGAMIRVTTLYGEYVYRITACEVKLATDDTAYDLTATAENIILYTCYPFNELGLTNKRYFVYGEYVSGPRILLDE